MPVEDINILSTNLKDSEFDNVNFSFGHLEKGFVPIEVTDSGMLIFSRHSQYWKAEFPIDVTEEGRWIF